eukprot:Skav217011  [mRNA]  locus=scaffold1803:204352:208062:- [translate_table: standard]
MDWFQTCTGTDRMETPQLVLGGVFLFLAESSQPSSSILQVRKLIIVLRLLSLGRHRRRISQGEAKEFEDKLEKAEVEVNRNEQLERQRVYGETLIKAAADENEALRKTMGRWQERRRSAPSILDNKIFLEKELLEHEEQASHWTYPLCSVKT